MNKNKRETLGEKERYQAGKSQMKVFYSNQYLLWRVVAVKSIRKLLLTRKEFYADLESELVFNESCFPPEQQTDIINNQIKNGWFFEAVSQAEQAIEDLFSLLKHSKNIAYFAKHVVNYRAGEMKSYIWNFRTDDLEYILTEFGLPYFPLDEPWEHIDIFEEYKACVLLMAEYLNDLIAFHQKYYTDYCQYKHGMAISLCPFGAQHKKGKQQTEDGEHGCEGALMTFDNYSVNHRTRISNTLPQLAMYLTPDVQPYVRLLHDEENLLHFSMHHVNIDEVVATTEKAYTLISVLWSNLLRRCEISDEDKIHEWVFPTRNYRKQFVIGFPIDKREEE